MIFKIAIWGFFLFGTVFLERRFLLPRKILLPDIFFLAPLLGLYLILIYMEIRSYSLREKRPQKVRWRGFHFTFLTGVLWWAFISFSANFSWFADPIRIIGLLAGLFFGGLIFGLLGMTITQFMITVILKKRKET
jgi:protein-S-isoprenylcysteine O-methyltransferase Ste14